MKGPSLKEGAGLIYLNVGEDFWRIKVHIQYSRKKEGDTMLTFPEPCLNLPHSLQAPSGTASGIFRNLIQT